MSPKKNAFFAFLQHHKNQEKSKGNKTPSFQELAEQLKDKWKAMSDDERSFFKTLADDLNKNREKYVLPEQISCIHTNSSDYSDMKSSLARMFENLNSNQLLSKKFILFHINCHSHTTEQYYFPAEIAALEFNIEAGVTRRYHEIVGISKIYPRGYGGAMRIFSERFHQIHCWEEHWDDYEAILLKFIRFIKDGPEDVIDLNEDELDLPYIFTIETETAHDIMKMKSSLEKLCTTVLPNNPERAKSLFKIGSVNQLLVEIIKKLKIHLDRRSLLSKMTIQEILEADMYGVGLGCTYHCLREVEYKCSKARILQWLSNICKYVSEFIGLELVPGKHVAALMKNGARRIFDSENVNVPITLYDTVIDKINSSKRMVELGFYNESSEAPSTPSTILEPLEENSNDDSSDDF